MSMVSMRAALTMVGVSGVGLGGYGIYRLSAPKETIGDRVTAALKGTKKRFIGKGDSEWSMLQEKYISTDNKPKSKDGLKELPFEDIENWCDKNYRVEYSIKTEALFEQLSNFCFFNTNTILEELEGHSLISGDRNGSEWQSAWDSYNSGKSSKNLAISNSGDDSKLNGGNRSEAAPILYDWCKTTSQVKMYSTSIDILLPRFKEWCISK
ncbi:hypothetical protein MHC_02490 [Mycoplasma haemocanis str. Illinois]|uniref:Uncharacterized protein n=1 Tax=Mycoplasma haemocanis (strain Illinois) TaxID=1111676 RepID=H6N6U0_MYCHN|nr:hypothetical protein [Mycoplasma haemocanis]AEW45362.2 hypothetical protein MHC_02490 [Mycoplasma haemocanis str. Illinois]